MLVNLQLPHKTDFLTAWTNARFPQSALLPGLRSATVYREMVTLWREPAAFDMNVNYRGNIEPIQSKLKFCTEL
jgi:hypothetical protein